MSDAPDAADELRAIYEHHRSSLLERLVVIEDAVAAALEGTFEESVRALAEQEAHKVAGSAGMFGYSQASVIARQLEFEFMEYTQADADFSRRLATLVVQLRTAVEADPELDDGEEPEPVPTITVVTTRPRELTELMKSARERGLQVRPTSTALNVRPPRHSLIDLVIIDIVDANELTTLKIEALRETHPPTPVIALHPNPTAEVRADLSMQGVQAVCDIAMEPSQIVDLAQNLLQRRSVHGKHAAIVTWDDTLIRMTRSMLGRIGIRVTAAQGTIELWQHLSTGSLDFLMLDMDPDDSPTLHRALRQDAESAGIPLLNIFGDSAQERLLSISASGTDGALTKPVREDQLIDVVVTTLERTADHHRYRSPDTAADPTALEEKSPVLTPASELLTDATQNLLDVVLVEDDEALAPLLLHSFSARGLRVEHTTSGSEAIRLLAGRNPELRAKVVLLDWNLPGATGLQVLQEMSTAGVLAHTKVIMLTGRSSETEVLRALALGASDHVAKPFSVAVLMQRIDSLLAAPQTR